MRKLVFIALGYTIMTAGCDALKSHDKDSYVIQATIRGVDNSTPIYLYAEQEGEMKILEIWQVRR